MDTLVEVITECPLPNPLTLAYCQQAAEYFVLAAQRWSKPSAPWCEVSIYLVDDAGSAAVNEAILGHVGPTDVITQRYDALPGETDGLVGELFVNIDEAQRNGQSLRSTDFVKEVLLYMAHGCDHLTDADDATPSERQAMRRRDLAWVKQAQAKLAIH